MPDQELLNDDLEALEQTGSPVKNLLLRQALGWDHTQYEAAKTQLVQLEHKLVRFYQPLKPEETQQLEWSTNRQLGARISRDENSSSQPSIFNTLRHY